MGRRISNLTHLKSGQPIDAARKYVVSGWASVNEGTQGPPIWDVVRDHVARRKTITVTPNDAVKVLGA
jgi:sulfur-oxidizing protein SoxB